MKDKREKIDTIVLLIVFLIDIYWIINVVEINENSYLLGLFRGFCWPTCVVHLIKYWNK